MLLSDVLREPAFAHQPARYAARERIEAAINAELATADTATWLERLNAARIPCAPVNDFAQALGDPQVLARDMVVSVPLAGGEPLRMPGNPVKLSDAGAATYTTPPTLGEQTDTVLAELLGYAPERLGTLRAQGVIA